MEAKERFITLRRTNGQTYYFNADLVSMVYDNTPDGELWVYGPGYEKKFRTDEAQGLLNQVKALTIKEEAPAA